MKSKTNNTKADRESSANGISRAVARHLAALYEKLGEPVPEELTHLV